jgi:hypothetical protein
VLGVYVRARVELALRYLEEGKALVERDPVQASEKLYKAAEEAVRALALYYDLGGALEKAERRGRWTFEELERAARAIAGRVGEWFIAAWDAASYLLVLGAHEAKLDSESVEARLPSIEKMVVEARRTVSGGAPNARSA